MADCLKELVGINAPCGNINEGARYFLNEASGITVRSADATANEEQQNGLTLLQDKIALAAKIVEDTFAGEIQKKLNAATVVENQTVGFFQENPRIVASVNKWKGVHIRLYSDLFLELYVDSVSLLFDTSHTGALKVYDLITGTELDSIAYTAVANEIVTVNINKTFKFNRQDINLAFLYDANLTGSYVTSFSPTYGTGCVNCPHGGYRSGYLYADGIQFEKTAPIQYRNRKGTLGTNGVSLTYSINCGYEGYLCSMRNQFAYPMFLKTCELIYKEMFYSKRLNAVILYEKAAHEELMKEAVSEFERSVKQIIKGFRLPDTVCNSCRKPVRNRIQVP